MFHFLNDIIGNKVLMETILQKLFFGIISLFVLEATLSASKHWQGKEELKSGI